MLENNLDAEKVYSMFWIAMLSSRRSSSVDELVDMVRPLVIMENSNPKLFANLEEELSDYFGNQIVGELLAEFIKDTVFYFKTKDFFNMSECLCMADEWFSENNIVKGYEDDDNDSDQ